MFTNYCIFFNGFICFQTFLLLSSPVFSKSITRQDNSGVGKPSLSVTVSKTDKTQDTIRSLAKQLTTEITSQLQAKSVVSGEPVQSRSVVVGNPIIGGSSGYGVVPGISRPYGGYGYGGIYGGYGYPNVIPGYPNYGMQGGYNNIIPGVPNGNAQYGVPNVYQGVPNYYGGMYQGYGGMYGGYPNVVPGIPTGAGQGQIIEGIPNDANVVVGNPVNGGFGYGK